MSLNAKCVPVEFVGPTFLARPKLPFGEEVSPHREPGETHECGRQSCMQHFVFCCMCGMGISCLGLDPGDWDTWCPSVAFVCSDDQKWESPFCLPF